MHSGLCLFAFPFSKLDIEIFSKLLREYAIEARWKNDVELSTGWDKIICRVKKTISIKWNDLLLEYMKWYNVRNKLLYYTYSYKLQLPV